MTDGKEDLERKAFEEWYCSSISESIGLERYPNGCYCNPEAGNMFSAWRAAKSHATQSAWISVKDKLPEIDSQYLVSYKPPFATGQQTTIAFFNNGVFRFGNSCGGNISHAITHWQPLPEPPEQVDK